MLQSLSAAGRVANFAWNNFRPFIPADGFTYASRIRARSWKFDRVTRVSRSHIEREVGRKVVKNTAKCLPRFRSGLYKGGRGREGRGVYKYRGDGKVESRREERKGRGWIFFLPRSSLLSSSIISFLRLYVFHGEIIFHANTKKRSILNFFKSNNFQDQSFLSARSVNEEYEMRHFKIISFVSNRWNDPRAIIFTPKGRKIPSTLLKVISNLRARTVPFSISRHLYFYQVSTDHHTLPPPWLINARDRSLNIFLEPVGIGGQGRNRLSLTLAVSHGVYTRA